MGIAVDIFTSQPPACYECAVCHDVLQSAVSFKECGHSFCEECAKACLRSKTCPNCRVEVTGFIPNFIVRESIGSIEVNCPHGCDESNKRARGDDGEAVPSTVGCTWTGMCQDLQNHENVCDFKMITCGIDGCNHECRRKDMNCHLSGGDGFLCHMNLMKQSITASYEAKMKNMQQSHDDDMERMKESHDKKMEAMKKYITQSITASYEKKINEVGAAKSKQISELKDEIKSMQRKISQVSHPKDSSMLRSQTRTLTLGPPLRRRRGVTINPSVTTEPVNAEATDSNAAKSTRVTFPLDVNMF